MRELLAGGRLLSLLGPGGVGKSRLATEAARLVAPAFPGGVWLIELAGPPERRPLPAEVLSTLGVADVPGRSAEALVADRLARRKALFVLDNCDRLGGEDAAFVGALLGACPQLTVLATGRRALGVAGETSLLVRPLPTSGTDPSATVPLLLHSDAARLFVDRAVAADPALDVAALAGPIAAVCRGLDGIPLAIELAAARVRALSVPDMVERLHERFRFLTGGATLGPRHHTMRETLEWSHEALDVDERTALAELSVFAGGFTLSAAEAVCSAHGTDVIDLLSALVDRSLVEPPGATGRYRILETVRQFVAQHPDARGVGPARRRHLAWVRSLARWAERALEGQAQAVSLAMLGAEHDNVRAAVEFARKTEPVAALDIAARLWRFFEIRGHLTEGRTCLDQALAAAPDAPARLRAKALNAAGILAQRQRDLRAASALHEAGLAISAGLGDRRGVAVALHGLGNVAVGQGDLDAARRRFEESLAVLGEDLEPSMLAPSLVNLGVVTQELSRDGAAPTEGAAAARRLYEQGLGIYRELRDGNGTAVALENLGTLAAQQGDLDEATSLLLQSLAIRRQLGERIGIAAGMRFLGQIARRRGELEEARSLHEESLTIERELGNRLLMAADLESLADIAFAAADEPAAQRLLEESLALYAELGREDALPRVVAGLQRVTASDRGGRPH